MGKPSTTMNGVNGTSSSSSSSSKTNDDVVSNVHMSSHPVLSHKITVLRSSATSPSGFRAILREVTYHLGYEATSRLRTRSVAVSVTKPNSSELMDHTGSKLSDRVVLVPILRSGLGMTDSMLELLPNAGIHHIGMYKNKASGMPIQYYNRLPRNCGADVAFVLDPVIATASTVMSVVGILKKWGVPKIHVICVIASRAGLSELTENHPDIDLTVGTVDEVLTDDGHVLPGVGDAGDRLFGTNHPADDDDEALLHPSKRKRSDAS